MLVRLLAPVAFLTKLASLTYIFSTEDEPNRKRRAGIISTEGPVAQETPVLMLPFFRRDIFTEVLQGVQVSKSYVINGPYQSGKASFLWALVGALVALRDEADPNIAYFDMTVVNGRIGINGVYNRFYGFLSYKISGEILNELELPKRFAALPRHLYLLVDEFQHIVDSQELLDVARDFFKTLSLNLSVSYVAVGTFKLTSLTNVGGNPFNSPLTSPPCAKCHLSR